MGGGGGRDDIIRETITEKNVGRVRPARAQQCGLAGELQFRLWHSSPWHATDQVVSRSWRSWGLKRLLRNRRQGEKVQDMSTPQVTRDHALQMLGSCI